MACLEALPAEVLCEIADWLVCDSKPPASLYGHPLSSYARDHSVLARSCRRLYSILNPPLYKRNIQRDAVLNSCLLWAAVRGLLGTIKTAHGLGADLDLVGPQSRDVLAKGWNGIPGLPSGPVTPLHLAVEGGELHVVEYLLEHGAAVHLPAGNSCDCPQYRHAQPYALHMALKHSRKTKEAAAMLIRHGAYLVSEDAPAALDVGLVGRDDLFQLLLEQRCPESTKAVLDYSIQERNLPLTQDILRRPELDLSSPQCALSSLKLAVLFRNADAVRALLSHTDVHPEAEPERGSSPLHDAASYGRADALHAFRTMRPDMDVNTTDDQGYSPFHLASRIGHVEAMKALTQYPDIKVNMRQGNGKTPLHLAAYGGKYDAIRFLINHPGVQSLAVDAEGFNVLHCLAKGLVQNAELEGYEPDYDGYFYDDDDNSEDSSEGSNEGGDLMRMKVLSDADKVKEAEQMIKELMSIGISIDQETPTSGTALRIAIRQLNLPMALALLACGCDHTIGFEGPSGWTMLHDCLRRRDNQIMQLDVVEQLVSRGVNIDTAHTYDPGFILRSPNGSEIAMRVGATPLFCAALLAHNTACMEALLEAGADPNADIAVFDRGDPGQGDVHFEPFLVALCSEFVARRRVPHGEFELLLENGAKLDEAGSDDETALEAALRYPFVLKEVLDHATSENTCLEHVQSVIDDVSSRRNSPKGLELLRDLKDFRDRVFGGE